MSGVNSKCVQNEVAGASRNNIVAVEQNRLPSIFRLNVDCFEDLFEWLSLEDLKSLRRTCKRMKQVVDYFIRLNYPIALQTINMTPERLDDFRLTESKGFELLRHINFGYKTLKLPRIEGIRTKLGQVESIELISWAISHCHLYESFLKYCTRLKYLKMSSILRVSGNAWLHQHYPTLELIDLDNKGKVIECADLKVFLGKNPTVRVFAVSFYIIWDNRDWMLKSDIKFDRLEVWFFNYYPGVDRTCELLNDLHERGFYKQLHVYVDFQLNQEYSHRIASLHALEGLALVAEDTVLSMQMPLPSLKTFFLRNCDHLDGEELANNLFNIQRITFECASIGSILPFIRRCPRLNQIRISKLLEGDYFENGIIDLLALNNERKKLANKRKITIFIAEDVLLTNKWNQPINLSFIELDRDLAWQRTNPFRKYL